MSYDELVEWLLATLDRLADSGIPCASHVGSGAVMSVTMRSTCTSNAA